MKWLRQSTATVVSFGPMVDKDDGITLLTGQVGNLDSASVGIMLSKNGGTLAVRHATVTASVYDARGLYKVTLDTTDTATLGILVAIYEDATTCIPVWESFMVVPQTVYDAMFTAGVDSYQAKIKLLDDDGGNTDRYAVIWFKNGQPVTSGITSPTIQVYAVADGSDLIASTAMTQIASTGTYRYTTSSGRVVQGVQYIAKVQATIDSATREWRDAVGRDS